MTRPILLGASVGTLLLMMSPVAAHDRHAKAGDGDDTKRTIYRHIGTSPADHADCFVTPTGTEKERGIRHWNGAC